MKNREKVNHIKEDKTDLDLNKPQITNNAKYKWFFLAFIVILVIVGVCYYVNQMQTKISKEEIKSQINIDNMFFCGVNNDPMPQIGWFELDLERDEALVCFGKHVISDSQPAFAELTNNHTANLFLYTDKNKEGKGIIGMVYGDLEGIMVESDKTNKYIECLFNIENIEYLSPADPLRDYANFAVNIYHYLNFESNNFNTECKGTMLDFEPRKIQISYETQEVDEDKLNAFIGMDESAGGQLIMPEL